MNWIESAWNVSSGSYVIFTSAGLLRYLNTSACSSVDKCAKNNLNIGLASGAIMGVLQIYRGFKN